MTQFT